MGAEEQKQKQKTSSARAIRGPVCGTVVVAWPLVVDAYRGTDDIFSWEDRVPMRPARELKTGLSIAVRSARLQAWDGSGTRSTSR